MAAAVKLVDFHFARTRLLALESAVAAKVISQHYIEEARRFTRERDLILHLDGPLGPVNCNHSISVNRPQAALLRRQPANPIKPSAET